MCQPGFAVYITLGSIMAADKHALEVMSRFQRYIKSRDLAEIERYSLENLLHADESLGDRDVNADFRIALRNRIQDIQNKDEKNYQSWVRVVGYVVAFVAGVLATLFAGWLA